MSILKKYQEGTGADGIEPTGRRAKKNQPAPNPGAQYDQYFDESGALMTKEFLKAHPMPMPADFKSYDGRSWDKMLTNEKRAANFFSNNPMRFNVATGQCEATTNSSLGTTHGGNSMNYTGSTSGLVRPEGGMRYVKNPYTGKEVGVPANRWALDIGYTPQKKKGGLLFYQTGGSLGAAAGKKNTPKVGYTKVGTPVTKAGSMEITSKETGKTLKGEDVTKYRKELDAAKDKKAVMKKWGMIK